MIIPVHPAVATKTAMDTQTHYVAPGGTVFSCGPDWSTSIVKLPREDRGHRNRPSFEDVCAFAEWQRNR